MIKIRDMNLPVGSGDNEIKRKCAALLEVPVEEIKDFSLSRVSVDARKKSEIRLVCTAALSLDGEEQVLQRAGGKNIFAFEPMRYSFPQNRRKSKQRPVVVGMGPAGLFCALHLARAGCPPIILERGRPVEERTRDVESFWSTGKLNEESNVQFGEGGAGTFSDGKLTTGISDPRISRVFEVFTEHGAPEDILWSAKPHIGTDVLRHVVTSIRRELISLGCELRFEHRLAGISAKNSSLTAISVEGSEGKYEQQCDTLILAPGHSARDTFEMLFYSGVVMEQKAFAMGVRIEHLQSKISRVQYGDFADRLPPADYKLACHLQGGRSAYSFCVCPGGQVVAAGSQQGRLVTNGMSNHARDGKNINGGYLVGVRPGDFCDDSPLGGMRFQQFWEERAFRLGGGGFTAPAQTLADFMKNRVSVRLGEVQPSYLPGVKLTDLSLCLPDFVTETLRGAVPMLDGRLHGFAAADAVMTGIETRSSSPVRILRGEDFQSSVRGLYPCGEGAGYAGGITSAAVDGIKVAEQVATGE